MRSSQTSDLWWKNAVFYCLDVEKFLDGNGDGVGDFEGLTNRVDYLHELGVTCIWLMPFYPSPGKDDGYDIADFYGVDRRLGDHGDLVEFLRAARDSGMRVIVDFLVNHTSEAHPWFRSALRSKNSAYRDYYVWRSEEPPDTSDKVVFPDKEDSIWTKDEKSGEWYLHNFYRHQPDLNTSNPAVRDEIAKAMGFWLELGVDGFRIDAVPFSLEVSEGSNETPELFHDPHEFLRDLRRFTHRRRGDSVLLGEVNLPYKKQVEFFGDNGDQLTMMFDFMGMQYTYLSLARKDARPLGAVLRERPQFGSVNQWATFLRNHDELTLDKLTDAERQEVFDEFAPEEGMRVFDRGIKRRLPSMLEDDPRRIRMAYSLMFSMGGSPVLFYGEEIGMGEDLAAEGRMAVRTPMQWSDGLNGGFSEAAPSKLVQSVVEGARSPEHVNAADARRDPDSLLTFIKKLVRVYRRSPEIGWGRLRVLEQPVDAVLAHCMTWTGRDAATAIDSELRPEQLREQHGRSKASASSVEKILDAHDSSLFVPMSTVLLHNFSPESVVVPLDLKDALDGTRDVAGCQLWDMLADDDHVIGDDGCAEIQLEGYGYKWLRIRHSGDRRLP
ncbi:MAG: alpha-amylase family protein [Propionibacteriaceae bacterium]|nr:alpha-amylase family protein [Propionibacteriaceae bacterium]